MRFGDGALGASSGDLRFAECVDDGAEAGEGTAGGASGGGAGGAMAARAAWASPSSVQPPISVSQSTTDAGTGPSVASASQNSRRSSQRRAWRSVSWTMVVKVVSGGASYVQGGRGGRRGVPIVAAALEHCFRHSAGGAVSRASAASPHTVSHARRGTGF